VYQELYKAISQEDWEYGNSANDRNLGQKAIEGFM
jgi:hypothetical protein